MFMHQFFNWSESIKKVMPQVLGVNFKRDVVESLENFYEKYQCIGYQSQNEEGNKNFLLSKEPIPFENFPSARKQVEGIGFQGGVPLMLNMNKGCHDSINIEDISGQQYPHYMYEVDRAVKHNEPYEYYISRLPKIM